MVGVSVDVCGRPLTSSRDGADEPFLGVGGLAGLYLHPEDTKEAGPSLPSLSPRADRGWAQLEHEGPLGQKNYLEQKAAEERQIQ